MCQCLLVHVCSICSSFFVGVAEAIIGWLNCDMLLVFFSVFLIFCLNPFAPGDFAKKRVLKLVEWFSGHCRAIKS